MANKLIGHLAFYYFVILSSCIFRIHNAQGHFQDIPKITISYLGETWKNFSTPTTDKLVIYSIQGDDIIMKCEAPFPIQWNFTGLVSPPEVVKIQPPKVDLYQKIYEISVNIFFWDAEKYPDLGASVRVACEKRANHEVRDELFVIVRGNNSQLLVQPKTTTVVDSRLIPCATKDPSLVPALFMRNSNGKEEMVRGNENNIRYHLTEGFRSNQIFNGVYICRQGFYTTVTINALSTATSSANSDYDFYPRSNNTIRVFSEETLEFRCSSKSRRPLKIFPDNNANITISYRSPNQYTQVLEIASNMLDGGGEDGGGSIKGKVVCVLDSATGGGSGRDAFVKEWSYEIVETPELFLDNFEGEVDCLSSADSKMVQTVRCKNSMDCAFMSHCLENVTFCNFKKQKQFFATTDTNCWVQKLDAGKPCASVPYSHLNGLAQCSVGPGLVKKWEYFVSLDFLKYSDWRDAPERELLRMDEVPSILYTNGTTQFFCMAVAYLFADSLSFEIEYKNGSRMLLRNDGKIVNISSPGIENPRKIDEFNIIGVLDMMLNVDAVGVRCLAPWWNATGGLKATRKFETRHLLMPKLVEAQAQRLSAKEVFYTGKENQRLSCHAQGEPQPEYQWYFNNGKELPVSEIFPELKTSLGSHGEGYLEFPLISDMAEGKTFAGEYRCVAGNRVGKVERIIKLDVSDEPISGKSVIYIVSVVIILLILAFVMAMLVVFMRRYKAAQKLVRSLTDSEIEEFFQGKPELLANERENGNNVDVVEFLPFKKEYEIPFDNLEFDSSEKNLLGSGEFAYVVRGRIISENKPVAIKISKTSADVTLFKSLLSEVKIMIYIGIHENVVALVGVCTEGIRNRSIHIATDICDLGSLDAFLRKARPTFLNLINANQEIDMLESSADNSDTRISTLDLVSFSAQIAKGMEYLAYKSVVHADLAGRNILLTGNKTCKISDFGLSKKLYECNNYVKKSRTPLPWRWMAIESLNTLTFSTSSDIWAYGVTLFEIFTLGDIPFPNEEWNKEFLTRLASGMRMGRPKYSTQEIYSKIVACWENEPELRPSFTTLRVYFEQLLNKHTRILSGGESKTISNGTANLSQSETVTTTPTGESFYANYNHSESPSKEPVIKYAELDHSNTNQYMNVNETPSYSNMK